MWFSGPIFETWQNCGYPGECSKLFLLEPVNYWMTRFREIIETEETAVESSHVLRLCRFQQILAEGMQIEEFGKMNAESSAWRQKACQLLSGGTPAETSLVSVAKSMNLSYTVFRKRFVHLTGTTPGKFRTGEIMKRACTSLINTNSALSEIAESLGFHDQFHFSRRFKQEFGLSPSEFRRQVPMESR